MFGGRSRFTQSLTWYAERSVDAANSFDAEFDRALALIETNPERFPACDARHRYFLLRRFPFRVIYRIAPEEVVILAVAHNARSSDFWSER